MNNDDIQDGPLQIVCNFNAEKNDLSHVFRIK